MATVVATDISARDLTAIDRSTEEIGRWLFGHLKQPSVLDRRWWDDRIMAWAMADESVKLQAFRFIDVMPMLDDSESILRHLHEYFDDVRQHLPAAARLGIAAARPGTIAGRALAFAARKNALNHARRFIAGANAREVLAAAMRERKLRRAFTLDTLGEAVTSELEADRYLQAYLDLLEGLAPTVNRWPEVPQIDRDTSGELPRVNLSVKMSALDSQFDPVDPQGSLARAGSRLRTLLRAAQRHRAFVHVDMESYVAKDLTLHIFKSVLAEEEFRRSANVGIVIQCYLRDAHRDLVGLRDWAGQRGTPIWVRLVKGAYWDYETTHAKASGWPIPVYQQKWQSDVNFEQQTRFLMLNQQYLRPALGSHNIRSLAYGIAVARHLGLPINSFELQMLYGMADAEKQALITLGHRLRIYMPFGELIPGMAYLVRRLLENTSNDSFLRASFSEQISPEKLLLNPASDPNDPTRMRDLFAPDPAPAADARHTHCETSEAMKTSDSLLTFKNEPLTDFAIEQHRQVMDAALGEVKSKLGQSTPLWIDGRPVMTTEMHDSKNPSDTRQIIGRVAQADATHAQQAVAAARTALPAWWALGVDARADFLVRAAEVIRRRRFELCAWEILECGKTRREADGDVAEAIDFCTYYARGAVTLQTLWGLSVPGEDNRNEYLPRGVAAVIAPWNFPLAILTGMTVAALATGNTVVMKPAEQSSVVGAKLMEIFDEVGLPAGVLNNLSGPGETVGAALVEHPEVAVIAFTGSRPVGLAINRRAAEVSASGIPSVKRVIAELGGKNAIIVDDDADLDEAVLGVIKSAFGFQGQKCSACSRVIVLEKAYEPFLQRLVEAARSLKVGPAEETSTTVGPVIDADSRERILQFIEVGKATSRQVLASDIGPLAERGYFVGPQIFADVPPDSRLAQEEIFGPVLAVIRAKNLDDALAIANRTDYALTAGLFSRSPAALDRARRELLVGNLYLNRGITGALVGRQPFGGFKMSGIGSKAGGPDYLLQFVLPRTVTENTLRRGFAPPETNGN